MSRYARHAGPVALVIFVAATVIWGAVLDGYSHREHPMAMLGAAGIPGALIFNTCAFVLPGMLVAVVFWTMRSLLPAKAGWQLRIGMQLAVLSALAFAAQGLFPLNADDPGSQANALHALAWTFWWIAFAAAGVLLASGGPTRRFRWAAAVSTIVVLALALAPWPGAMAAFAPRLAFVAWFVWVAAAPRLLAKSG